MDLPEVNYTDQYVAFCQRANLPINEVPEAGQKMGMSYEIAMKELDRLTRIPTQSPEYNVSRTYIEWLVDLPWSEKTDDRIDLGVAKEILDEDHYLSLIHI